MCDTPLEVSQTNQADEPGMGEETAAGKGRVEPARSGADPVRIADGHYVLRSGTGERVLDIEGDSDAEMANAQLYRANGTAAQIFSVAWDADTEAMTICHAGLRLTKEGGDGIGNVWQSTDGACKAQRWVFEPVEGEDGWYFIRNLFGFYLDVDCGVDADCTNVKCWEFNGSPAQRWKPVAVSGSAACSLADGDYVLRSAAGKWVLDIEGDSDAQASNARLSRPNGSAAQVFNVAYDENGGAMAIRHAGMYLDKQGGDGDGNVWQFEGNATSAQRWFFEPLPDGNGCHYIRDRFGYYLGVGDALDDGTYNLVCQGFDGSPLQQWRVINPSLAYATVTLPDTAFTYTGAGIEPAVAVSLGSKTLQEGTDFEVAYRRNVDVGTAGVIVSGTGAYKGRAKATFEIGAASIRDATVTPAAPSCAYRGKAVKPKVTVALGDAILEKGTDYAVSYDNNTDLGTATVTVTGKGNYEGSASATFEIVPAKTSLKKAAVTLERLSYTYTGEAIEPPVGVTLKGQALERDTDYSVEYADNTDAGTATVTVTGAGCYKGVARATFKIGAASVKRATVTPEGPACVYTGRALKPSVTVTLGDKALRKGSDYAVAYDDNTDAGTAAIAVAGKGNYKGFAKATFEIRAAGLDAATVTTAKATYAYANKAVKPDVTVVLGGKTLKKGSDYTVAYADNACVGTATVTVAGKGNYEGSASTTFKIVPAKVAISKAKAQGKGITVAWEALDDVSGYQVQVAANDDFTQIKRAITVEGERSSSAKLSDLAMDGTCYVRVRAFVVLSGMRYYSAWSAKKVKVK